VVVDVGCGPRLPYSRSRQYFLVGVDASFESVRLNRAVDLRIFGSASCLPFKDCSVDVVLCFYLLHHLIGHRVPENYALLEGAFREFGRVLRPGGSIYAFEVNPVHPFFAVQTALWYIARRLWKRLDMFFWSVRAIRRISLKVLPAGTELLQQEFHCPFWVMFPFVFAWPGFQLPRGLYPFRAHAFEWRVPSRKL
jgi:SAM-dependent methyltransferase